MKNIKCFNFKPDDHYGYPEINDNETGDSFVLGLSLDDLLEFYAQGDCTAFAMEGGNPDEMSDVFLEYGNYDLYGYGYMCINNTDDETLRELIREGLNFINDTLIVDGAIEGCNEEFMKDLSEKQEVDTLFAIPSVWNNNQEFMIYRSLVVMPKQVSLFRVLIPIKMLRLFRRSSKEVPSELILDTRLTIN